MSPTSHTAGQHERLEEDGVTIVAAAIRVSSAAISAPANLSQTLPSSPKLFFSRAKVPCLVPLAPRHLPRVHYDTTPLSLIRSSPDRVIGPTTLWTDAGYLGNGNRM